MEAEMEKHQITSTWCTLELIKAIEEGTRFMHKVWHFDTMKVGFLKAERS